MRFDEKVRAITINELVKKTQNKSETFSFQWLHLHIKNKYLFEVQVLQHVC